MSDTGLTPSPAEAADVTIDDDTRTGDTDANDRVHHHARVGDDHPVGADGAYTTLCGLRITPRPDAGRLPCCPMCALTMGRPCR